MPFNNWKILDDNEDCSIQLSLSLQSDIFYNSYMSDFDKNNHFLALKSSDLFTFLYIWKHHIATFLLAGAKHKMCRET